MRERAFLKAMYTGALILFVALSAVAGENTAASSNPLASDDAMLIKRLKDENLATRASAAQLLGERKCSEAVKPLMEMLKNDNSYQARISAGVSLSLIGDTGALEFVKERSVKDPNQTVRSVLVGVAKKLETAKAAKL
ncbi:hypothetical protein A2V82_03375 [candidate division KSB1 bacterium RBG_16_48_16]|nr:MAG: hypothetical protein A2V82_03375 [candidate division KSB1 bacterium RBG_16_48_16]